MAKRKNDGLVWWIVLGLVAGSFIPDKYSPLALFKKKVA